jgi:hypothetical protein
MAEADDAPREVLHSPTNLHTNQTNHPPQRLKAALWFAVGKIVDEESLRLGVNATPQFIGALTEMVWAQTGTKPPFLSLSLSPLSFPFLFLSFFPSCRCLGPCTH